jgi:hypothetical protein
MQLQQVGTPGAEECRAVEDLVDGSSAVVSRMRMDQLVVTGQQVREGVVRQAGRWIGARKSGVDREGVHPRKTGGKPREGKVCDPTTPPWCSGGLEYRIGYLVHYWLGGVCAGNRVRLSAPHYEVETHGQSPTQLPKHLAMARIALTW